MQTVYGLIADLGDGSNSLRWFKDKDIVDCLLDDDMPQQETYYGNEGSPAVTLTFPDDFDVAAAGIRFFPIAGILA